jgi:hypothetical protein
MSCEKRGGPGLFYSLASGRWVRCDICDDPRVQRARARARKLEALADG